jgi:hypothetical protein
MARVKFTAEPEIFKSRRLNAISSSRRGLMRFSICSRRIAIIGVLSAQEELRVIAFESNGRQLRVGPFPCK